MRAFSSALNRDRRADPREVVNRRAKVLDGPFPLNAVIKDVSVSGARLVFPDRMPSQDAFVLVDLVAAMAYECRVAWRKSGECGVRLIKGQDLRGLVPGQFDAARRVWHASR
jgi:hypothetical protein